MKNTLSQNQIVDYRENGFLAIPDFLDAHELATWRQVADEAVAQRIGNTQGLSNTGDGGFGDAFNRKVFTQCLRLADIHAGMRELIYDARIAEMVGTLAGVDGIRVWHDQALFKPPYGNGTAWHLDTPYWSFHSRDALSIWIALDDATLENGCMWYVPGSHKTATFDNVGIGQNMGELFNIYPQWKTIAPVPVPLPAGGAAIHNGLCAHGAGANMTNRHRRAMTCAFMPDGCTFNGQKNILPKEMFEKLKPGDPLNDPHQNPLLWSRRK